MSSPEKKASTYEAVLYPAGIFPQTHPDRLATIGTLRGMCTASVHYCRVLELACGAGNNLITMAFNLPNSEFIGLDRFLVLLRLRFGVFVRVPARAR